MIRALFILALGGLLASCGGATGGPRTLVANVELADPGSAEICLVGRHGYDASDNCIQRVRLPSGEERLDFSGGPCPPSGLAASVEFSLDIRPEPGQLPQLYDVRGGGVSRTQPVGALNLANRLDSLCSGPLYGGPYARCELQIVGGRWGNLVPRGANPCN